MANKSIPDVVDLIKQRQRQGETAANSAKDARLQTQDAARHLVSCVIGPVGGPYKPCLFSADANIFMPVFKE